MLDELVLHSQVRQSATDFLDSPVHALIINGPEGAGKGSLARQIIAQLLELPITKLANYPYLRLIEPVKASISIEAIRSLHDFLRLKTAGSKPWRRAVLVEDANLLTIEAQNAFLKILEEPPADTIIILTSSRQRSLLSTIHSRAQRLDVKAATIQELQVFFSNKGFSSTAIQRAYYISNGQVALMTALLEEDSEHELASQIESAKSLLQASHFERLKMVDTLAKQKADLPLLLYALKRIVTAALTQAADKEQSVAITAWKEKLQRVLEAETALQYTPQSKLLLTDLLLNL